MKAQFATFEALASAAIVLVSVSAISSMLSGANANSYEALYRMRLGFAEHDLIVQIYKNTSLRNCVYDYINNHSSCIHHYEALYSDLYGISLNISASPGQNASACFAMPADSSSGSGVVCISG